MGDRSNVFFQEHETPAGVWQGIGFYSHWGGRAAQQVVLDCAIYARARLGDPSYFIRRTVHLAMNEFDPQMSETGVGLWTQHPDDNEHPILVINAMTGMAWMSDEDHYRESAPTLALHLSEFKLGDHE